MVWPRPDNAKGQLEDVAWRREKGEKRVVEVKGKAGSPGCDGDRRGVRLQVTTTYHMGSFTATSIVNVDIQIHL